MIKLKKNYQPVRLIPPIKPNNPPASIRLGPIEMVPIGIFKGKIPSIIAESKNINAN